MRAFVLLAALVLASGALAGCVNAPPEDRQIGQQSVTPTTTGTGNRFVPSVLAPLAASIQTQAPKWVAPGTEVQLSASAPANAKGDVTYVWAVGAVPGTAGVPKASMPDTGSKSPGLYLQSGQNRSITFDTAGSWVMHCHPHPWMLSNVTVIDGYEGPASVDVYIVDGNTNGEFRFVPENVFIGKGGTVVYHNVGSQPHTATAMSQEPPIAKLPIAGASGTAKIEGDGWKRVFLFTKDGDGRIGVATHDVYVKELPAFEPQKFALDFNLGGLPPEASAAQQPFSKTLPPLANNGTIYLNFTVKDAVASNGGPVNNAQVTIHLKEQGASQDTLTADKKSDGQLSARAGPTLFNLVVIPEQGVKITGTLTVEIVYDLTPPAPTMAGSGGGHDDHGGGGHHH